MPANPFYEGVRGVLNAATRRLQRVLTQAGTLSRPPPANRENPLGGGGNAQTLSTEDVVGYDSGTGLNVLPFTSDVSVVPLDAGTAQAGAVATITLRAGASAVDDAYNDLSLFLMDGTGAGQDRIVTDYVGATKVATVHYDWDTVPDATSEYVLGGDPHVVWG